MNGGRGEGVWTYNEIQMEVNVRFFVLFAFVACTVLGFAPVQTQAAEIEAAPAVLLINVNTASAAELQRLPGIGRVTAQSIIDYRTDVGEFSAPEDLLKVKGIGPKTLEGIRDQIDVN